MTHKLFIGLLILAFGISSCGLPISNDSDLFLRNGRATRLVRCAVTQHSLFSTQSLSDRGTWRFY